MLVRLFSKRAFTLFSCLCMFQCVQSQLTAIDSLKELLSKSNSEIGKIELLSDLSTKYSEINPDSSLFELREAIAIARKDQLPEEQARLLGSMGRLYALSFKRYDTSVTLFRQGIEISRLNHLFEREIDLMSFQSSLYFYALRMPDSAIDFLQQSLTLARKHKLDDKEVDVLISLGSEYFDLHKTDTAERCMHRAFELCGQDQFYDKLVLLLEALDRQISNSNFKIALALASWGMESARKINNKRYIGNFLKRTADIYEATGDFPHALETFMQILLIDRELKDRDRILLDLQNIALVYEEIGDHQSALGYLFVANSTLTPGKDDDKFMYNDEKIQFNYQQLNQMDSADYFAKMAFNLALQIDPEYIPGRLLSELGRIYSFTGKDSLAMESYRRSKDLLIDDRSEKRSLCETFIGMSNLFLKAGRLDSGLHYARLAFEIAQTRYLAKDILDAANLLAIGFSREKRFDSAFAYQKIGIYYQDSLSGQAKIRQVKNLEFNEKLNQQKLQEDEERFRNRTKFFALVGVIVIMILVAGLLFQNKRQQERSYELLMRQNELINLQRAKVEGTLRELKSTQAQLIQSEKLASLGQLTAGIAHEIQNPLNFVRNFSEVTTELIDEMKNEFAARQYERGMAIATEINENMGRIVIHSARADGIVKSMLQHSIAGKGIKESIDINILVKDQLFRSYNNFISRSQTTKIVFESHLDTGLGRIMGVTQHLSLALHNLFDNAFYSLVEKMRIEGPDFEPLLTVSTRGSSGKPEIIEVIVRDNAMGISGQNIEKIFQPFFTTKPPGHGTGLGLSLSYEIIKKEHNGDLLVHSESGIYSEFIILLPSIEASVND